jgi:hypothetical protein
MFVLHLSLSLTVGVTWLILVLAQKRWGTLSWINWYIWLTVTKMKFSARILLRIPHQNPCNGFGCTNPTDGRAASTSQCCPVYVLCTMQHECHTQVLMFLNKLDVLPFGSIIYPKRKGRMVRNYGREWRQSRLLCVLLCPYCLMTYCAQEMLANEFTDGGGG